MAKKKYHYYVLVMTEEGPKFVTKVNYGDKTAEYDKLEKPLEFSSKEWAEDVVLGLILNWNIAYLVCQKWEIEHQPYNYEKWEIEWKEKAPVEAE